MRTEQELLAKIASLESDIDAEKLYSKQAGEAVEQIAAERDELSKKLSDFVPIYTSLLSERDELSAKLKALESEKEILMEDLKISDLGNEVKANKLSELERQEPVTTINVTDEGRGMKDWEFARHIGFVDLPVGQHKLYAAAGASPGYDKAIHYPECWDTAAYPTIESALHEITAWFKCSNEDCTRVDPSKEQFDIRGKLAARLSCWHRLTESESDELVKLFEVGATPVSSGSCVQCKFLNISPDDAPCCNCNHLEYYTDNFVHKEPAP